MNLAIDIGNTCIKAGFFNQGSLDCFFVFNNTYDLIQSTKFQSLLKDVKYVILSNVTNAEVLDYIKKLILPTTQVFLVSACDEVAFRIDYENKESLGTDRIAAVWGAIAEFPNDAVIVIDAGTCIKYNVVINKTFVGGAISPGLLMRYKAMHHYTGKLPLLEPMKEGKVTVIGKNTFENIHSGVINGCVYEMERFIDEIEKQLTSNEETQLGFSSIKMREGCEGCGERSEPQYCPEERSDEGITEAEAKPVAARPDPVKYSNYFTGEGHAQNINITKDSEIKIILTGGDAHFFANLLERKVFLRPYLILNGLNEWLEYKKKSLSDT